MVIFPGTSINNRYKVRMEIGRGATGITWVAFDTTTGIDVVLKELQLEHLDNFKSLDLFQREIATLKNIDHPNIPDYKDHFEIDDHGKTSLVLVQEYAAGKTLFDCIGEGKRFSEKEVKEICATILKILSYLHTLRPPIIHRDINPKNIIIGNNGKLFLVDFGAVGFIRKNTLSAAMSDTFVGTIGYMPPEQLYGKALPASDLYSLGVTLVFLLSGKQPHEIDFKNLGLDYYSHVDIDEDFREFIDLLVDPTIEHRLDSAATALKMLKELDRPHPAKIETTHSKETKKQIKGIKIGPPPRHVPFSTRLQLWNNASRGAFDMGLIFVASGLVFAFVFVVFARVIPSFRLIDANNETYGTIITVEDTDSSENDVTVYKNVFIFHPTDTTTMVQYSFTSGRKYEIGDKVTIRYITANPKFSVIEGERYSLFSPFVLFVLIFPAIGYGMLLRGRPLNISGFIYLLRHGKLTGGIISDIKGNGDSTRYYYTYTNDAGEKQRGKTVLGESNLKPGSRVSVLHTAGFPVFSRLIDIPLCYTGRKWQFNFQKKKLLTALLFRVGFYIEISALLFAIGYTVWEIL
ncbi:MAG: protein kinase [Spirochaetales bacterium]|nr:protein kinase [Spirochaetales bacterium]